MVDLARGRAIHLIDLENLLGVERTEAAVVRVWAAYQDQVGIAPGDQVVVGTGPALARLAWFVLPDRGLRRVVGRGVDGADRALLDAVDLAVLAKRYRLLVLASGDHAFTGLARAATGAGLVVWQVAGHGGTAASLAATAAARTTLVPCGQAARVLAPTVPAA